MTTKHIIVKKTTDGYDEFECLVCGQTLRPDLPIKIAAFVAMGEGFKKIHRACGGAGNGRKVLHQTER